MDVLHYGSDTETVFLALSTVQILKSEADVKASKNAENSIYRLGECVMYIEGHYILPRPYLLEVCIISKYANCVQKLAWWQPFCFYDFECHGYSCLGDRDNHWIRCPKLCFKVAYRMLR